MKHNLNDRAEGITKALDCLRIVTPIDELVVGPTFHEWDNRIVVQWSQYDDDVIELDDAGKRASALAFLARWARRLAKLGQVEKDYGDDHVAVTVELACGWSLQARAEAAAVCTYVDVLDPETGEPVMEATEVSDPDAPRITKLVPKTERICPPSLLQGASL